MKYIAVIIVVVLMSWTWSMATSERSFRLEQYKQVELGVEDDIRGFIQKKYPDTKEIYCSQLYTEAVNPGTEMIAHFRCSAASAPEGDEVTEQIFEGFLRLKSTDGFQTWGETGGEIRSPEVRFLKGVQVTPEAVQKAEQEANSTEKK